MTYCDGAARVHRQDTASQMLSVFENVTIRYNLNDLRFYRMYNFWNEYMKHRGEAEEEEEEASKHTKSDGKRANDRTLNVILLSRNKLIKRIMWVY